MRRSNNKLRREKRIKDLLMNKEKGELKKKDVQRRRE